MYDFLVLVYLSLACGRPAPPPPPPLDEQPSPPSVVVWRAGRTLFLVDAAGAPVLSEPIGIGRGGLVQKADMDDLVTPTGTFTVDLILDRSHTHDAVAPAAAARFSGDPAFAGLLADRSGLAQLFANMNGIDFDGDGAPDEAYGAAYIGLHSAAAVTGPKMRRHSQSNTPYWYSIALHGTPDLANLGAANSGGCVHVGTTLVERLIAEGIVRVGSMVQITDERPE